MATGEIHLIIGCMFSGKSTELLKVIKRFKLLNLRILAINHVFDKRYGTNKIISHDKNEESCIQIDKLNSIVDTDSYKESDVIVIEEAHFFEDLYDFVMLSCSKNKKIYVAGLSGDYKLEPIGEILRLIPCCDTVKKLSALCLKCNDGTDAYFSKRIDKNNSQILVGSDEYIPVCRKHL